MSRQAKVRHSGPMSTMPTATEADRLATAQRQCGRQRLPANRAQQIAQGHRPAAADRPKAALRGQRALVIVRRRVWAYR